MPIIHLDTDEDDLLEDDLDDEDFDEGDFDEEEIYDEDLIESEPRSVLITGASGNIGRKLRAAWTDVYDMVLIDKETSEDDPDVIAADLSVLDEDWMTYFHGVDTVVHLAANGNEFASWEELIEPNLDTLFNVLHAAALAGVDRIVFASSNHVMGGYQDSGDASITVELPPQPDGPYGVTKLVAERMGRSLAKSFDLTFIALRLGWIQPGSNRPESLPHDWARKLWLSNSDLVRLFDCAVEAEIEDRAFVLVNGMSRNHGMRWDLTDAAEILGYMPEDDAFTHQPLAESASESAEESA
ncbi:MAG: NAD-dependent dehydratase [Planctomycetes bacterium SCN 63-9]|nr:MAG: NAD-dependent dehydratase [Planctomycetes bacterium SCN 63-9]